MSSFSTLDDAAKTMCGIAGLWLRGGGDADDLARAAHSMTSVLAHRGPDDCGVWCSAADGLALGHRRLSIVDLSPSGHQPMASSDGRFTITYNGEIYNYRELRERLHARGARFRGSSDTEVILEGCVQDGVAGLLPQLNGMFAFAIWDSKEKTLYLARDRMGEKPLYYMATGSLVLFASELKALRAFPRWKARISPTAAAAFLRHGCVPGPGSIYEGVRKLPPGGLAIIRDGVPPREERYWSLRTTIEQRAADPGHVDENEAVDALDALLRDAVSLRMIADVPLGAFLSGGYDSSTVVALMQANASAPVRTFTASFEQAQFDEAPHAEAVARHLGTEHTTFRVEGREACEVIPKLSQMYDEPFADSSQIPTHLISLLTRQQVTVALSGDGGDELFTGYNRYHWAEKIWAPFARMPWPIRRVCGATLRSIPQGAIDCLSHLLPAASRPQQAGFNLHRIADLIGLPSIDAVYEQLVSHTDRPTAFLKAVQDETGAWTKGESFSSQLADPIDRMRYADLMTYLPDDVLTKVDRASMAVGLEVRAPILDHRVVEWVWRLPPHLNSRARRPKHLLRCVLERYVPATLVDRPKRGFGVPLSNWLRGPLHDWAESLLSTRSLENGSLLDPRSVQALWVDFLSGSDRHQYLVWNVLMLADWARAWRA